MRIQEPMGQPSTRRVATALRVVFLLALLLTLTPGSTAFPPAPYYTIYGDVRDELGKVIPAGGATIIFSYQSKEIARYPLTNVVGSNYSYQIRMRTDMNSAGTTVYNSLAVTPGVEFTLKVDVGGVSYLPIEFVAKLPKVGSAADRVRLDLTIGADTDKDGLPDAWERALLFRLGYPIADLWRITPDGILEADGLTNLQKYIAGTYSADTSQSFYLKIKEATATDVGVEFFTLTNKIYSLDKSTDLATWTPVDFTIGSSSATGMYTATGVGVVAARIPWVEGEEKAFYRLKVR